MDVNTASVMRQQNNINHFNFYIFECLKTTELSIKQCVRLYYSNTSPEHHRPGKHD